MFIRKRSDMQQELYLYIHKNKYEIISREIKSLIVKLTNKNDLKKEEIID
ncbi:hypothetical protein [Clostridium sp.]